MHFIRISRFQRLTPFFWMTDSSSTTVLYQTIHAKLLSASDVNRCTCIAILVHLRVLRKNGDKKSITQYYYRWSSEQYGFNLVFLLLVVFFYGGDGVADNGFKTHWKANLSSKKTFWLYLSNFFPDPLFPWSSYTLRDLPSGLFPIDSYGNTACFIENTSSLVMSKYYKIGHTIYDVVVLEKGGWMPDTPSLFFF